MSRDPMRPVLAGALILAAQVWAGCTSNPTGTVGITGVNVTAPASTLIVTGTLQLKAAVQPTGSSQGVTWSSSDVNVATVDAAGLVTGVLHGSVIITATSTSDPAVKGSLTLTVSGCPTPRPLGAAVNAAMTLQDWIADPICFDYVAANTVNVNNALLTIEPGTVVGFDAGRLLITQTAGLSAAGTAARPIRLAGTTPARGSWDGVVFDGSTHPSNRLEYITIEHGGGHRLSGAVQPANLLFIGGASSTALEVVLRQSAGYGLHMNPGTDITGGGFRSGAITGNALGPAYVYASVAHLLGGSAPPVFLTGNDRDVLDVVPNIVTGAVAWNGIGIPYRILDNLSREAFDVTGSMTLTGPLTIEFEEDMAMNVSGGGKLVASGTAQAPVLLTGTSKVRGHWRGLRLEDAEAVIDGMIIEYGGHVGGSATFRPANLQLRTGANPTRLTMRNSTLRESANYGLSTRSVRGEIVDFHANTLTKNTAGPAYVSSSHLDRLRADGTYTGNDFDRLTVSIESSDITENATWHDLGLPYLFVPGAARQTLLIDNASLTIEPGVEIYFSAGMGIKVLQGASLTAIGTQQKRITLRGDNTSWQGINVEQSTASFDYLDFLDAGSTKWSSVTQPASVTVTTSGGITSLAIFTSRVTSSNAQYGVSFGFGPTMGRVCLTPTHIPPPDQYTDHCQPT